MALVLLDKTTSNQILQLTKMYTLSTHHFDNPKYLLMIDFKYTVVNLLILIGFAMFTGPLLVHVTFTLMYAQMAKQTCASNITNNTTTQNGSSHLIAFI